MSNDGPSASDEARADKIVSDWDEAAGGFSIRELLAEALAHARREGEIAMREKCAHLAETAFLPCGDPGIAAAIRALTDDA
jgi:hypothetical protein